MLSQVLFAACGSDDHEGMGQTVAGMGGASVTAGTGGAGMNARAGAGAGGGAGSAGRAAGSGGSSSAGRPGAAGQGGAGRAGQGDDDAGVAGSTANAGSGGAGTSADTGLSFFVSSQKNMTGNLGGLAGADQRCQQLAAAAGQGDRTWHAYLSAASDPASSGQPVHARDRIGKGPWFNARGVMLAADLAALHALKGDAELFVDERGNKINGQWQGSPTPNEHDVLTGSTPEGMLMQDMTCRDWTSTSNDDAAQVGHSDGLGPNRNDQPPYDSWNSSHANGGCADTAPRGGAGRIYCFAVR